MFFVGFGGSSIDLVVRYWIGYPKPTDFFFAQSEGIVTLKEAYDRAAISIPFPIRTLDFGIKGGVALGDAMGHKR